jgi:hypothetical protein
VGDNGSLAKRQTLTDFPPRQKPAKFNVEEVLNNLKNAKSAD